MILDAATVVCVRHDRMDGWKVLLGQSQVKNWLCSTSPAPDETVAMRYPGEWKFPGGVWEEKDGSVRETALRELREEFVGIDTAASPVLHAIGVRVTLPVRGRQYRMHNFVAFADENHWLNELTKDVVNRELRKRIDGFEQLLKNDAYFLLPRAEKLKISPELYRVEWFTFPEAIEMMRTADVVPLVPVDDWQQDEFQKYGIRQRDSMYVTMKILQEVHQMAINRGSKAVIS
uniref:Nudix hydrolase domain-containing protein n=1 Tax=Corethron hystrix TaxID=216773 RepID=A0A7S1BRS9_9STRA|mmetsp:Transcript_36986/g.86349  ORF Transcript_36986/g.86349 Transcript_36986/m.86349 type:complete len:232 (+) Transcript_36986:120-815(+)